MREIFCSSLYLQVVRKEQHMQYLERRHTNRRTYQKKKTYKQKMQVIHIHLYIDNKDMQPHRQTHRTSIK